MLDKFNFYDLLGYLLPGATVVLTLYWISTYAFGLQLPALQTDFGSSVFFLGLSYLVGQLVHGLGSIFEDQLNKESGGQRLSEKLLLEDRPSGAEHGFTPELRGSIFEAAEDVFGVAEDPHEIFEQCYALVVQKGLAQHTEIFLALNGMARSMLAASSIGFVLGVWLVANQAMLHAARSLGSSVPSTGVWGLSQAQLQFGLVAIVAFGLAIPLLYRAFRRFRFYFAESVYYNFLAWYGRQMLTPTTPI
jgi:hypothetical protein